VEEKRERHIALKSSQLKVTGSSKVVNLNRKGKSAVQKTPRTRTLDKKVKDGKHSTRQAKSRQWRAGGCGR